jgi:hypothetical protein
LAAPAPLLYSANSWKQTRYSGVNDNKIKQNHVGLIPIRRKPGKHRTVVWTDRHKKQKLKKEE